MSVTLPPTQLALDTDVVHGAAQVVDRLAPDTSQEEVADDPDVTYSSPMPNVADARALSLGEGYLNDSGVFDLPDPGVFVGPRDREFVLPFEYEYWQLDMVAGCLAAGF